MMPSAEKRLHAICRSYTQTRALLTIPEPHADAALTRLAEAACTWAPTVKQELNENITYVALTATDVASSAAFVRLVLKHGWASAAPENSLKRFETLMTMKESLEELQSALEAADGAYDSRDTPTQAA